MGRSWYWMKCSELAYLQTADWAGTLRSKKYLTVDALTAQCEFIYGKGQVPKCDAFNSRHGGASPVNGSQILFLDYSDDPWHTASVTKELSPQLPFIFTTCDGCGHCGSGVPAKTKAKLALQKEKYLKQWLN
jgi:hypothetical protein